jgi:ATP-dependent DNA ligase
MRAEPRMGVEGIVAKRRDRPYRSGRSPAYCKWVAKREPDKILREFYAKLSIEWEKEAAK